MKEFFAKLMASDFMPHGHCYYWAPEILWSHAISNSIIALAYCAIPLTLIYIFKKRDDFKFIWMMVLFAIFILGCGITHIMDVIVIWEPIYRLDAFFRIITAFASIGTAIVLIRVTPDILKIPTSSEWQRINLALQEKQAALETMLDENTRKNGLLQDSNLSLQLHKDKLQQTNDKLVESQKQLQASNHELTIKTESLERLNIELKAAEKGLIQLNNDLEERVRNRTAELEDRNNELVKINNDLDNFIYTASHDLKTPVVNLEGLISMLKVQLQDSTNDKTIKIVGMTEASISKMKDTIVGLTEIVKVQKDTGEYSENVNIKKVFQNVKLDIKENILEANASIEEDLEIEMVRSTKNNIRSILHNLLTNAIKYRSPERKLKIKLSSHIEKGFIVITMQDNGLGISGKYQPKLFTMFKRVHTHVEGTGIGLYIIKRIVENSKGKILLESEPDMGSTFKIYLPL